MKVPMNCLPTISDNDVPTLQVIHDIIGSSHNGACLHEGRFYQDEAQWTSFMNPCKMCYCQSGHTKCDITICPEVRCPSHMPIQKKLPGECCSVCTNASQANQESNLNIPKGCNFGNKFYSAGIRFHPFLIQTGFDFCTECICDPVMLEVKCTRQPNEKLCVSKPMKDSDNGTLISDDSPNTVEFYKTKRPGKSAERILKEGGCKNPYNPRKPYENGQKFHPYIDSLGEYKCVTCKCKDGEQSCERQKCTKASCHKIFRRQKNEVHHKDLCCSLHQCKKFRRHHRGHNS